MRQRLATGFALAALTTPALAHPGKHGHLSPLELVHHLAEPDHLALMALAVFVVWGILRWNVSSKAKARVVARFRKRHGS